MAKTKLLFDIEKLLTASPEEKGICRVALEVLKRISKNKNYLVFPIVTIKKGVSPEKYLKEKTYERKLEEKYQMAFPFGAMKNADEFIIKFKEKYGKDELLKIVKANFNNVKNLF